MTTLTTFRVDEHGHQIPYLSPFYEIARHESGIATRAVLCEECFAEHIKPEDLTPTDDDCPLCNGSGKAQRTPAGYVMTDKQVMKTLGAIAYRHGLTVADITGPSREVRFIAARHEAMFTLNQELGLNLKQTGYWLGRRDHSTVVHGVRRHKERMNGHASQ